MGEIRFPAICIYDDRLEVFTESDIEYTTTVLSYKTGVIKDIPIYDSEGTLFKSIEATPCREIHFFERVFCFLWSPFIKVNLKFKKMKAKGNIDKLKTSIKRIIRMDDDIYCQFMEKDDIYKIIDSSESIKELILNVKTVLDANADDLEKDEQG